MSYEKQTWATGDTITAEKLNHMEDGIAGAGGSGCDIFIYMAMNPSDMKAYGEPFDVLKEKITNGSARAILGEDNGQYGANTYLLYNCYWTSEGGHIALWFSDYSNQITKLVDDGSGEYYDGTPITWTYDSTTKIYTITPAT